MNTDSPTSSNSGGTELAARREHVRRSVVRASRAVMAVLAAAFLLGVAMVIASYRAHDSQRRAEAAEVQATERLWNSYLAQARAERLSTKAGHRAAALTALSNAAAIRPTAELRDEAIATFGLSDLVREVSWPLRPGAYGYYFDPGLEHYVVRYEPGDLSMFKVADNTAVRVFRAADAGLGAKAVVKEFNFSLTGLYVAVQYTTGELVLWERDTGRAAQVFGGGPASERLAWRPTFGGDDQTFCARSEARPGRVVFIDLPSQSRREIEVPGVNETMRMNHRGDAIAWHRGNDVLLHDARNGALQKTFSCSAEVMSFRWDWKGEQISVWCKDGTLNVIELHSGRVRQLGGRIVAPWVQQFSPDGSLLASAGNDGTSRLWDLAEGRLLAQTKEARAIAFSRDSDRIAFAIPGQKVGVWRITKPNNYRLLQGVVGDTATVWHQDLSPDGRWAVWSPPAWVNRHGFELFDLAGNRPPLLTPERGILRAGFHPTEPRLIVAGRAGLFSHRLPEPSADGALRLDSPESIRLPEGFQPRTFSFSADGRRAVVASVQGSLVVLDLNSPGSFTPLEGRLRNSDLPGPASVTGSGGLALSPDGRWVVAGRDTTAGQPALWDAQTGKLERHLPFEPGHIAFSPDGRWLASVGVTTCAVWDARNWHVLWQRPRTALLHSFGVAAFTRDGSLMAFPQSVDEIELVRPATGQHVASIASPNNNAVAGLRFSADGHTLTAPGGDGRIHVWNLQSLRADLAKLRLDWSASGAEPGIRPAPTRDNSHLTPTLIAGAGLSAVGLVGLLAFVVLRRHGRLTQEFIQTTETAAQQARELEAERELNELKNRFVSMVSHEFRTPLGITMSAIELLRNHLDILDEAKREELFDDIFSSTRQMAGLMEQVLVLGRVEAGKLAFRPAPVDLAALCAKLVDESLSATNRRCPISLNLDGSLGEAQTDEPLLRHIFSNLLSNAVKYSPAGQPVEFTARRAGANAVFTVRDHGIGIPEADLPKLFDAFNRATNVGDIPGTGLGLVIVKRCVDLHGGTIDVRSKPSEGTTFRVTLRAFGEASGG